VSTSIVLSPDPSSPLSPSPGSLSPASSGSSTERFT
jgi:hypothetical protein